MLVETNTIHFGTDWLYPNEQKKKILYMLASAVGLRQFQLCIIMNIKIHLVFELFDEKFNRQEK